MKRIIFTKHITIALTVLLAVACDKDYNTIGETIIGDLALQPKAEEYPIKVYNQKVDAVQSNNLPIHQLGILDNGVFDKTRANFVTQLSLQDLAPTFTNNVVIDSVLLTVPYFSTKIQTKENGLGIYKLDKIYCSSNNPNYDPINLKIFRNGFSFNDYDPNTNLNTAMKYYSNQDNIFSAAVASGQLNDDFSKPQENTQFVPSNKEYVKFKTENNVATTTVESRNAPAMRLHLNKNYFQQNVINAGAANLKDNASFASYFKGLYFQVQDASVGSLMQLDFTKGNVVIYYKQDKSGDISANPVREMKTITMNMAGFNVNLFTNTNPSVGYANAFSASNQPNFNAQNIYLKGGEGSKAVIELFENEQQIQTLRAKNLLINDASLYFTVNTAGMDLSYKHPLRIYLYDLDNDKVLYDYIYDSSTNSTDPKRNKIIFDGLFNDNTTKTYRIRITEHINKILKKEIENVRLGLVITEDINISTIAMYKTPKIIPNANNVPKTAKSLPVGTVIYPLGTVLYGNTNNANRVQFKIYYTEPNK